MDEHDLSQQPNAETPGEVTPPSPEPAPVIVPEPAPASQPVVPSAAPEASASYTAPEPPQAPAPYTAPLPPAPEPQRPRGARAGLIITLSLLLAIIAGGVSGAAVTRYLTPASSSSSGPSQVRVVGATTDEPAAAAAAVALPSVVNIDVRSDTTSAAGLPNGHPSVPSGGTGSGVAYKSAPGGGTYVITNDHVVTGAKTIMVTPASGEALSATLVGTDPQTDIAVVKVSKALPLITLGDSEKLVVGQMVVAIGSPFGLQHSVSSGIVSAVHRAITGGLGNGPTSANPLVDAIQTDAAINPGNSGGALVDRRGLLVGINSAIFSDTGQNAGIGFAIPVKTAVTIADQLIATGTAKHPFLGITGQTVDSTLAKAQNLPVEQGALVQGVFSGTGAAKAGMKVGDIIVAIDGQPVRSMSDVILDTRRANIGDTLRIDVYRGSSKMTLQVVVGDKPATVN